MTYRSSVFLALSILLLNGCIPQPDPTVPPVTAAEISRALDNTESNMKISFEEACSNWSKHQRSQLQQINELKSEQAQMGIQLDAIQEKLSTPPPAPKIVTQTKTATCPPLSTVTNVNSKMIVGEVEWLWIEAVNKTYEARIDTGATTSSISATQITPFEKDGQPWVRFQLSPDDSDAQFEIEAPLVRYVKIRQASSDTLDRRPVASLTIRIGKLTEVAQFTLTDRSDMNYPILLGREFLKDIALVDVARKNIQPKPESVTGQPEIKSYTKLTQ